MAIKSLLTYGSKVSFVQQLYYSPTVIFPVSQQNLVNIYCLLSRVEGWNNNENPDLPQQTQRAIKDLLTKCFVAKKITSNNISPVVKRIDWREGQIYDYYRDDVDMFEIDENDELIRKFYVKNRYDQVFKCLWNNNGEVSTVEPYFEPGSYGTNNVYQGIDNYKWKYIYTVDNNLKLTFMDSAWLPVKAAIQPPNSVDSTVGKGGIDVINIINSGSNYDTINAVVSIVVTGDGTGATGVPVIVDGEITDVLVSTPGSNYSYANAEIVVTRDNSITTLYGSGATAISPVSPIGGHGYDPITELGCRHVMMTCEFSGSENDNIPTDIDYHQVALVINPVIKIKDDSGEAIIANSSIYKTTTDLILAPGFGDFLNDEIVYQGTSLETATFFATVLSFDNASNTLKTVSANGILKTNAPVKAVISGTIRTLLTYDTPLYDLFSGNVFYIEDHSSVQRSSDGIEQYKIVLGF